jgi:DNA-directed RNA polymerase subunit RPC12/RpoP
MVRILGNKKSAVRSKEIQLDDIEESLAKLGTTNIREETLKSVKPKGTKCLPCQKSFKTEKSLKFHKKVAHQGKFGIKMPTYLKNNTKIQVGHYKCSICDDKFESPSFLEEHTHNVHRVERRSNKKKLKMTKIIKSAISAGIKMTCARKLF